MSKKDTPATRRSVKLGVQFIQQPRYILSECLHCLDPFGIRFRFTYVAADADIPVVGAWNYHLRYEEKVVNGVEGVDGRGAPNSHNGSAHFPFEKLVICPAHEAGPLNQGLHPGGEVGIING